MNRPLARASGFALILLALSACGSEAATSSGAVSASPSSSPPVASSTPSSVTTSSASSPAPATRGSYIDYAAYSANPALYSTGKVVLFFHANWCPKCRETDENLTSDPGSVPVGLTIVKADFDSEIDLRQRLGVTVQHTFVQVDATGNELAKWTGTYNAADIDGKTV